MPVGRTTSRWAVGVVAVAVVSVSGCDGSVQGGPSTPSAPGTTPPQSSESSSTSTNERAAVEAAYRLFWSVSWDVDKQPPARWRSLLASVSVDPQLTRLYAGTKAQRAAGIRLYGQVVPRPSVGRIAGGRAEVTDCQDASHAGQADARTGAPKTVGVARAPVTASVVRGSDGGWRVAEVRYRGGSC